LQNGAVVNPDGSYQLQNKKQKRLKNGECLDLYGNRYKNQQEFNQQMQIRSQAMAQEHLMLQDGQMYRIQNQERTQLQEQLALQNGSVVMPDGSVKKQDREQLRLKDGECLDMEGNRYENQERWREKMEQRGMDRMDREKGKEKGHGNEGGGTKGNKN
jgi:hypothetical protein